MPTQQLKSYSEKYNVPLKLVERFWNKVKEEYIDDYEAISGTVKKMCQTYKKSINEDTLPVYKVTYDDNTSIVTSMANGIDINKAKQYYMNNIFTFQDPKTNKEIKKKVIKVEPVLNQSNSNIQTAINNLKESANKNNLIK